MEIDREKQKQWADLAGRIEQLLRRGGRGLRRLPPQELLRLIDDYQSLTADLARARSFGGARSVVDRLNRIAVAGHILLYGRMHHARSGTGPDWFGAFGRAVRQSLWAIGLSAGLLFGTAALMYFAVQIDPSLAFDLVPADFLEFDPASSEHYHEIPSLARPLVSSAIMANNIQVTLFAFAFGLTAGLGTTWILVFNGAHLGAVMGWLTLQGHERALWGWIMPHGGTELIAITLAGGAGFLLAGAIVAPGLVRRTTALKAAGTRALVIEFGCMVMLVIAGLIEGFVSPSGIGYPARLAILALSVLVWILYFSFGGKREE